MVSTHSLADVDFEGHFRAGPRVDPSPTQLRFRLPAALAAIVERYRSKRDVALPAAAPFAPRFRDAATDVPRTTRTIDGPAGLGYRANKWGLERLVVDGVSNHLPHDSGGTVVKVLLKQNGAWVDFSAADKAVKVDAVAFADNGRGYDYELLGIMESVLKDAGGLNVGQFGEGLKLIATAALRAGVKLEFQSRNWSATPDKRDLNLRDRKLEKLTFNVTEYADEIEGSRTVITDPPQELMDIVWKLPELVLHFAKDQKVLFATHEPKYFIKNGPFYPERILAKGDQSARLYIKGVSVKPVPNALFSYDLFSADIHPDRNGGDEAPLNAKVAELLKDCDDEQVLQAVILAAAQEQTTESTFELRVLQEEQNAEKMMLMGRRKTLNAGTWSRYLYQDYFPDHTDMLLWARQQKINRVPPWVKAFHDLFDEETPGGEKRVAVLGSENETTNMEAELMGYKPVVLNRAVRTLLTKLGVPTAKGLSNGQSHEYRYVADEALTEKERELLSLTKYVQDVLIESGVMTAAQIPNGGLRIFSARVTSVTGKEDASTLGYCEMNTGEIGIRRDQLQDEFAFLSTYVHELGHAVTKKGDADREFTDFFVRALAAMMMRRKRE